MHIDVKAKEEDGTIVFEGRLNGKEVGFLLSYAINDLLVAGVEFNMQEPEEDDDGEETMRIKMPQEQLN